MSLKLGRRAYKVMPAEFTEIICYVMAESPSAAKAAAIRWDDNCSLREDYPSLRAKRIPELDEGITEAALVEQQRMWTECPCGHMIDSDEWEVECEDGADGCEDGYRYQQAVFVGGRAYCSHKCAETYGKPETTGIIDGICLYTE